MLTIEKGIPLPKQGAPSHIMDTCLAMDVGDSFYHSIKTRPNLDRIAKQASRKFSIARDGDGWRVWRVA